MPAAWAIKHQFCILLLLLLLTCNFFFFYTVSNFISQANKFVGIYKRIPIIRIIYCTRLFSSSSSSSIYNLPTRFLCTVLYAYIRTRRISTKTSFIIKKKKKSRLILNACNAFKINIRTSRNALKIN